MSKKATEFHKKVLKTWSMIDDCVTFYEDIHRNKDLCKLFQVSEINDEEMERLHNLNRNVCDFLGELLDLEIENTEELKKVLSAKK